MITDKHVKVTFKEHDEEISYVGRVIYSTTKRLIIQTKVGEMTFDPVDVTIQESSEQQFNDSPEYTKEPEEPIVVSHAGEKKTDVAIRLYKQMMAENNNQHPARKDVIQQFMSQVGLTKAGASTYQQSIKTKINNENL